MLYLLTVSAYGAHYFPTMLIAYFSRRCNGEMEPSRIGSIRTRKKWGICKVERSIAASP